MLSLNNKKLIPLTILILLITSSIALGIITDKPDIATADYDTLYAIHDIGDVLADRILIYIESNPDLQIDDLLDVNGIGPIKLERVKEVYK